MLSIIISIIVFFLIFSLLVLIHEGGHFWMAKRAGVKVEEFGFGLPPRAYGKKYGDTIYSVNWIPFGGFVRLYGEDLTDKKAMKSDESFIAKSARDRILIVCGGVIMNFLLAWFLLFLGFVVGMKPLLISEADVLSAVADEKITVQALDRSLFDNEPVENLMYLPQLVVGENRLGGAFAVKKGDIISRVDGEAVWTIDDFYTAISHSAKTITVKRLEDGKYNDLLLSNAIAGMVGIQEVNGEGVAAQAGIVPGDKILALNGQPIENVQTILDFNQLNKGQKVNYTLLSADMERKDLVLTIPEDAKIGIVLQPIYDLSVYNFSIQSGVVPYEILAMSNVKLPVHTAAWESMRELKRLSVATISGISSFFKTILSQGQVPEGVSGPVGIAQMVHVSTQEGLGAILRLTALLSLSLAVLNILPIPALDGGRLLFILIEIIRGKRGDAKLEAIAHYIGYILLMLMIFLVTYNDIVHLIKG